ncbi:hypothetical protein VTJ04DRAFT_9796 [Mycothermus thermophilus]|uniref:uncharacterized protein n=1 Tax=Humicola insolens TaxID=85995 RepID=UPI003743ED53
MSHRESQDQIPQPPDDSIEPADDDFAGLENLEGGDDAGVKDEDEEETTRPSPIMYGGVDLNDVSPNPRAPFFARPDTAYPDYVPFKLSGTKPKPGETMNDLLARDQILRSQVMKGRELTQEEKDVIIRFYKRMDENERLRSMEQGDKPSPAQGEGSAKGGNGGAGSGGSGGGGGGGGGGGDGDGGGISGHEFGPSCSMQEQSRGQPQSSITAPAGPGGRISGGDLPIPVDSERLFDEQLQIPPQMEEEEKEEEKEEQSQEQPQISVTAPAGAGGNVSGGNLPIPVDSERLSYGSLARSRPSTASSRPETVIFNPREIFEMLQNRAEKEKVRGAAPPLDDIPRDATSSSASESQHSRRSSIRPATADSQSSRRSSLRPATADSQPSRRSSLRSGTADPQSSRRVRFNAGGAPHREATEEEIQDRQPLQLSQAPDPDDNPSSSDDESDGDREPLPPPPMTVGGWKKMWTEIQDTKRRVKNIERTFGIGRAEGAGQKGWRKVATGALVLVVLGLSTDGYLEAYRLKTGIDGWTSGAFNGANMVVVFNSWGSWLLHTAALLPIGWLSLRGIETTPTRRLSRGVETTAARRSFSV